jgi:pimeloyl-ACP methyl ester carboxylesterase
LATYVLVPGACWGGIVWSQVASLLRAAGHDVFAITLTGLGERAHLASPNIDLGTHIQDVVGLIEYYDLRAVRLVGHSYGGMVITGAADLCIGRVAHLVFVDAHAPRDGESAEELAGAWAIEEDREMAREHGDSYWIPPAPDDPPLMRPHPLKSFVQRISLKNLATASIARTYLCCTQPRHPAIAKSAERAKVEGWRYHEFPTGHMVMLTMPNEVADVLLRLV